MKVVCGQGVGRERVIHTMGNSQAVWNHEKDQADKIARRLIETKRVELGWRALFLPFLLMDYIPFRRSLSLTKKNLLFTKRLAFDAAYEIFRGKDRLLEIGAIDAKTKEILGKEAKGFYTEKVRRKQLHEIQLLIDHYHQLISSNGNSYSGMIQAAYGCKEKYLSFLNRLHKVEQEVIQAAITTMGKGSKKDRVGWFKKVRETSWKVRMEEFEKIFSDK
jgi:hypothetical protein